MIIKILKNTFSRMAPISSNNNTGISLIEKGKKVAAYKAIDDNVDRSIKVIGIGSGSTIVYAIERLAQKVQNENLNLLCVPSSFQSKQLLIRSNLKITDLECINQNNIDFTIDGADEVDSNLNCIKGGGGCHLQEKIIAYFSKKFVIIADSRKKSVKFGDNWTNGIPIEVLPNAYRMIQEKIESNYGGQALLRESNGTKSKAGPVISDNGNFIVDWIFENNETNGTYDWKTINNFIKMIPGVIETGLFIEMADMAYFGMQDGNVSIVKKK